MEKGRDTRNYGIDLLRLFAMYMVVVLHVLNQGGALSAATGVKNSAAWLFEVLSYPAVNCYALISGFVCYREEERGYRYSKYLSFWLPVAFWCFGIALVGYILRPETVGINNLIYSALPVSSSKYWYVCAYTGLFFVIPWLNRFMRSLSESAANRLIVLLFVVFSVYSTISAYFADTFDLGNGYSFVWLVLLYIGGAWMKKNGIPHKRRKLRWLIIAAVSLLLTWLAGLLNTVLHNLLIDYISVTMLLAAVALVAFFSELELSPAFCRVIRFLSPAAFGVYIIHTHWWIWYNLFDRAFAWVAFAPLPLMIPQLLGVALAIFAVCLAAERLRIALFRLVRIDRLLAMIEGRIDNVIEKIGAKL